MNDTIAGVQVKEFLHTGQFLFPFGFQSRYGGGVQASLQRDEQAVTLSYFPDVHTSTAPVFVCRETADAFRCGMRLPVFLAASTPPFCFPILA